MRERMCACTKEEPNHVMLACVYMHVRANVVKDKNEFMFVEGFQHTHARTHARTHTFTATHTHTRDV
jgi:hypothetical protein